MYISEIELVNWKAFDHALLKFGKFRKSKNIGLVGADNGFGKTSLLEALILCLFGRDGMKDVGRGRQGGADGAESYDRFLERALHSSALGAGLQKMSVGVRFITQDGEHLGVRRSWYFSRSGTHKAADEEVHLYEGEDEDLVEIPRSVDKVDFVRNWVATNLVPVSLAGFFLFDGEIVRQLADESMSSQVRRGIEGILGVPTLKELADDLEKYAYSRRREGGPADTTQLDAIAAEVAQLEREVAVVSSALDALEAEYRTARDERDALTERLSALTGGAAFATLREVLEQRERVRVKRDKLREQVNEILAQELALALVAPSLVAEAVDQLAGEVSYAEWVRSRSQIDKVEELVARVRDLSPNVEPPLSAAQTAQVLQQIREGWHELWESAPVDAISAERHGYLGEAEKRSVLSSLRGRASGRIGEIVGVQEDIATAERELRKLDQQSANSAPEAIVSDLREKLEAAQLRADDVSRRAGDASRNRAALASDLGNRKASLARLSQQIGDASPARARADLAESYAELIREAIDAALPRHIEAVAFAMTEAYGEIAHKKVVKRIEIDPDCVVRLLGESRGRNLRELDQSAGEAQVFALSLISAIIRVSGFRFPIVMDTPIARLDSKHRINVLRHFAELEGQQLILLSQPTEVHGQYLDVVRTRVGAAFSLSFTALANGQGRTKVVPGYFGEAL